MSVLVFGQQASLERLRQETQGIVGAGDLARMKPTSLLVNVARAELMQPGVLLAALKQGWPGYAALDVYEEEPLRLGNPTVKARATV